MAANLKGLFGQGSIAQQILIWQVLGQVLSDALQPFNQALSNEVNSLVQQVPLTPAALADMVVRNIITEDQGAEVARRSGVSPDDFRRLVLDTGEAPPTEMLLEAFRRRIITWSGEGGTLPSAVQGLLQGRLRDEWIPLILELATVPIPVADAVDAVVEGQIPYDQGREIAYQGGVKGEDFDVLVNTRGNPPSPTELNVLFKRGLIPLEGTGPDATTVQQGIFEGATKDKWWRLLAALSDYVPPPRTVTAMVREGSMTDQQALQWFKASGLTQDLAAAYLESAHHQRLQPHKDLSTADILQLYRDQLLGAPEAGQMLQPLGWTQTDIDWLLKAQDVKRAIQAVNQVIGRLHNLYTAHKIDKQAVVNAFGQIGLPSAQQDQLVATWDVERTSDVKVLTAAEIASAFFYDIISQDEAQAELVALGYTPRDAWILLSVRKHHPQPNAPGPGLAG